MEKVPKDVWNLIFENLVKNDLLNFGQIKPGLVNKALENTFTKDNPGCTISACETIIETNTDLKLKVTKIFTKKNYHNKMSLICARHHTKIIGNCERGYFRITGDEWNVQDLMLTANPQVTFFKVVYKNGTRYPHVVKPEIPKWDKYDNFKLEFSPYLAWFL